MDFPIPGSPPIKIREPGTIPPPKTLFSSSSFMRILGLFELSISFIFSGFDEASFFDNPIGAFFGL